MSSSLYFSDVILSLTRYNINKITMNQARTECLTDFMFKFEKLAIQRHLKVMDG